ncbi:MAG: DSBA oxidoreductase [Candidatus Collierbacteria bacterium GW2011_GWF2_44_15]|uniref:DSBA oxidoreductase n=1 Tax=Candidatus Collierbacteria bacterium GW2011_GWF2_44_15 TaxID=1618404 RepID=A0A0G1HIR8_9BACT|nr:MAG: DSBA oxidoreductase [Candidatus Collierbacteria bacterium GW2011_GWF2_44_15]
MGKGWEMMDLLFEKQEEWSGVSPKEIDARMIDYATDLGLEKTDFEERSKSDDTAQAVNTDKALGDRLRLSGTPTVYVNGEQVSPDFVLGRVDELIKAAGEK